MSEEAKQIDTPITTPVISSDLEPEPEPTIIPSAVLIRGTSMSDVDEPPTRMEESLDSTYIDEGTGSTQQAVTANAKSTTTTRTTTLQGLNIGNFRKQLLSLCDLNVADVESWKSVRMSVKNLKHLEIDNFLKNPVLTQSYKVTKFQRLQTQLEESTLNATQSLTARNSQVDTLTITNQNFVKVSEDCEKTSVTEDSKLPSVNFEDMLGTIELPDVNSFQKCPTQFSLTERPDSGSTAPTSDVIAVETETIPEKCVVPNSNPASILNHLSSDLSEEMSDNGCVPLSADDVFKTDYPVVEIPIQNDAISPGRDLIINADNRSEVSERKDQQESIKSKTSDATKGDSKHPLKHNEEATTSVSHAIDQLALAPPRSEHNQYDHMVLNVSSAAKATDKNDSTQKEVVHTNKKEEAIVKSVFISVSQEEIKDRTAFAKEDGQEPMKGVMQVMTNLETKEIDRLEPVKERREYSPLNLGIGSRVSRELDVLVSFRNDDAKSLEKLNGNKVAEILRKQDGRASEIKAIIPLERFEMKCSVERRDGIKEDVNFYSSDSSQRKNHSLDLNGLRNGCLKQDGVDTSHIDDEGLKETRMKNKTCDIYKEVTMSTTGLLENAEYKNSSLLCTNQRDGTEMDGMNTIITFREGRRDVHENKTNYYPNERETPQETADLSQQETYVFEQHNLETISLPEILRSYVSYQTENEFPCIYIRDEAKVNETNKESVPTVDGSQNGDTLVGRPVPGQDAAKKKQSAEDGDNKHGNGFYSINLREISKGERKDHESRPNIDFEDNVENISRPTVEDDGRAIIVKVAMTQGQTEIASTKCTRKTADKSTDIDFINVSRPFHLTTSSTSSILRVSNNDLQANGGIRIMYEINENHPKSEPSMMSKKDKLKLLTSNFEPLDYREAETSMDTFMVTSSAIDDVRVPECYETGQSSLDFRRMNTSSINISQNVNSNSSVLPDLTSSNMEDRLAGSVGCVIKKLSSVEKKGECISPPKTVDVTQNNLANAPSTELQNQDDIRSRTSRRDVNGVFLTQLIADPSEMGNPLIRKDVKDEIYGTTRGDLAVQHVNDDVGSGGGGGGGGGDNCDATSVSKEAASTCQTREKTEKKCEDIERAKRELKRYSIKTQPDSENNESTNVQVGIALTLIGITKSPTYETESKIREKNQTQNDDQSVTTSVTRKVNKYSCKNQDAVQTEKNDETARSVRDMFIVEGEYKERRSAFSGHREALKMPAHLPTCPLKRYQETFSTRCFPSPIIPSSVSHSFKSTPNWSSNKLSTKSLSVLGSSRLHSECNSPTSTAMHVLSNGQRGSCSFVPNEKIVTNENINVANQSESLLSWIDHNQDGIQTLLLSDDQLNIPSGDLTVFPNLFTKKDNKADPMQPRPNPNVRKKNKLFQHEKDHSCGDGSADVSFRDSRRKKNNSQLNELMRYHLNRKKRWNPYEQWASMPPPPSPASAVHSPLKDFVQHDHNLFTEDMPSTPKTFRKERVNCKNLRELKELEKSLKIETSRINKPTQVKFQPYIFTSLEPYYDTSLVRYMMEHPCGPYPGYRSRQTALGLCDPAEDLKLDTYILPKVSVKTLKKMQDSYKKIQKCERRSQPKSSNTKQSFPLVNKQGQNMTKRQMTFSEGPTLRKELQQKYTSNARKKILQDYQRAKEDIYRVERNLVR